MVTEIDIFIKYLQEVKKMSRNTVLSYHRHPIWGKEELRKLGR